MNIEFNIRSMKIDASALFIKNLTKGGGHLEVRWFLVGFQRVLWVVSKMLWFPPTAQKHVRLRLG